MATDQAAIEKAVQIIGGKGWETALKDWTVDVRSGKISKDNTAMGWALYNNAANSGNTRQAVEILSDMVYHQRSAAQAVQATRILKKLSPEGQLYGIQRSVENLQEELKDRYGTKAPELSINEKLVEQVLNGETQEARDEAAQDLFRDIGRQMPSRFLDKWNAWRYLAMLGNPRTHVRNLAGNLFFAPVKGVKNLLATGMEAAASKASGGKMDRTKAVIGLGKKGRGLLKAAWADFANVQEETLGGGKYSDFTNANRFIEDGRVIFQKIKPLEKARRANSKALDIEDTWFSKPHYATALAKYCKARGITQQQIEGGKGAALNQARAYAIQEAQKAMYTEENSRYRGRAGKFPALGAPSAAPP